MHYRDLLYRALNPIRAREPLSGEGARLHGGRFNPKGTAALYSALSVMTAIREANQIGTLQPTTLVCYEADITPVFDATDPIVLGAYDMTPAALAAEDWRLQMRAHGKAPTQILAERLIADGYAGMRVRSFAKGATAMDLNMVLWVWGGEGCAFAPARGPAQRVPGTGVGHPCRSDRAGVPEAAQGQLPAELAGAKADGREGARVARHCLSDHLRSNGSLQKAYVQGISTRSVDDLVKAMGAGGMSKSQVSRLCGGIDERVNAFPTRPLEGAWPCLWLDATYIKVREGGVRHRA